MHEYMFNLIRLFYPDADAHGIDGGFYQDLLVFIARDGEGVEEDFGG